MDISLSQKKAHLFVSDNYSSFAEAAKACRYLAIGAHPDDLEVMAGHGVLAGMKEKSFIGVTVTSGGGSPRQGAYKDFDDQQMVEARQLEQIESARQGDYGSVIQLHFGSDQIKSSFTQDLLDDLKLILSLTNPQFLYTHNLLDKHLTHVAVAAHVVEALRELKITPKKFWGCEVWRGLDWLSDQQKVLLNIDQPQKIAQLINCHKSQTLGGKDYSAATLGRMKANSTFYDAHQVDNAQYSVAALDLLPLLENPGLSLTDFCIEKIDRLKDEVAGHTRIFSLGGPEWKS